MEHLWTLAAAILLDRWIGDPDWLWRRLPHPVVWFGKVIDLADKRLNGGGVLPLALRRRGAAFIFVALFLVVILGHLLGTVLAGMGWAGYLTEIVIVAVFIAHNSLALHVWRVADGYRTGGLSAARQALSMIVGRDTSVLDENGIARAAIESLAENFSDGVVAPVFWYAIGGLPGVLAYKFLNTADSMIGHRAERHLHFGRMAARLDDFANWAPARLSAILIACASWSFSRISVGSVLGVALRDAGTHRSPNAGWPEAAFATALNLQLGGPRLYRGEGVVAAAHLNSGGRAIANISDISRALSLLALCSNCLILFVVVLALVVGLPV
ncbi:MAG: adenosylcobinamide-phosphate synthase CbiB [Pseudomonadota bacterium]